MRKYSFILKHSRKQTLSCYQASHGARHTDRAVGQKTPPAFHCGRSSTAFEFAHSFILSAARSYEHPPSIGWKLQRSGWKLQRSGWKSHRSGWKLQRSGLSRVVAHMVWALPRRRINYPSCNINDTQKQPRVKRLSFALVGPGASRYPGCTCRSMADHFAVDAAFVTFSQCWVASLLATGPLVTLSLRKSLQLRGKPKPMS